MDMQLLAGAMVSLVWIGLLVSHIVDTRSRQDAERLILQPPVATRIALRGENPHLQDTARNVLTPWQCQDPALTSL